MEFCSALRRARIELSIISGREDHPLERYALTNVGTLFKAGDGANARKTWLGGRLTSAGTITIDAGAVAALQSLISTMGESSSYQIAEVYAQYLAGKGYDVEVLTPAGYRDEAIDGISNGDLDLIIDYLTYVFIPAFALFKSGLMDGWSGWAMIIIITFTPSNFRRTWI